MDNLKNVSVALKKSIMCKVLHPFSQETLPKGTDPEF